MFMSTYFVRSQVDFKPFADTIVRLVLLNISLLQICKNKSTKDLPDFSTQPDAKTACENTARNRRLTNRTSRNADNHPFVSAQIGRSGEI